MRSYFFILTLPIAIASWIISLVSQSVVTAQIGNTFVGPLWFATVLQLLVLLILTYALLSSTLQAYHPTLASFSTLIVVFAVLGVTTNIFSPQIKAQKALSASWLILAIIDLLWLVYFTTEHTHPVSHVLSYGLAPRSRIPRPEHQHQHEEEEEASNNKHEPEQDPTPPPRTSQIPSVPTNIDAFSPSRRTTNTHISTVSSTSSSSRVRPQLSNPYSNSSSRRSGERASNGGGRTPTNSGPRVVSGASASPVEHEEPSPQDSDPLRAAGGNANTNTEPNEPNEAPLQEKQYLWRAEALYKYDAQSPDPNELSFKKGEVLEISDKTGKWWEGRARDGRVGIVPSNYLRLL